MASKLESTNMWDGPVTMELPGTAERATFARVGEALPAAWQAVQHLSLTPAERRWLAALLTAPEAELIARESLERRGLWEMPFRVGSTEHELRLRPTQAGGRAGRGVEPPSQSGDPLAGPDLR
jgi:hypothetical protein